MKKIKLELTQQAYLTGNGNQEWYEAHAIDQNENDYIVYWEIRGDFDTKLDDDESFACNWETPVSIIDEFGNDINVNTTLILEGLYEI